MKSILCIEDDPLIQEFYKNILANSFDEFEHLHATTGADGLNMCQKYLPEIILLDIRLPDSDGLELCHQIKLDQKTRDIPVIIVSALGDDANVRIKALQNGADSFLPKPFNTLEFVEIVRARLRIKQTEDLLRDQNEELEIKYKEVSSYRSRLLMLNRAMAKAEEKERKRISEYLHDEIGATLSIANMRLSSFEKNMSPQKTESLFNEVSEMIGKAISDSRAAIYDISPPVLYEMGLKAAIEWKLEKISKEAQFQSELVYDMELLKVDQDIQIFSYRIVSEFLLNVMKHAEATKVLVKLEVKKNRINIMVTDNGKGFKDEAIEKSKETYSLGLHNMLERIESIGGKLLIQSEPDVITKMIVTIPIS